MGRAIDTISGFVTAPSTTLTALTMATGDSLSVRNCDLSKKIYLLDFWSFNQVAGVMRIRSPKLHDNVQGLRNRVVAASVMPHAPQTFKQVLYPQDTLIVEQSGSAVGGQIESSSLLVYYEDLPGAAGRFIGVDDLNKLGVNIIEQEIALTPGAGGGYTGQAAINATFDNFKANTDYALLGALADARGCSVCFRGADTANLRVSVPAEPNTQQMTREWFVRLARAYGLPTIPVFNSANKSAINVDAVQNQAAGAINVTAIMVELAKS